MLKTTLEISQQRLGNHHSVAPIWQPIRTHMIMYSNTLNLILKSLANE